MKLSFNKKVFLKAIKIGGSYAGNGKVLPILDCVKVVVSNGKCSILSYDERNAIKTHCLPKFCEGDISFCINKSDIEKYVSLLDEETFDLDIHEKHLSVISRNGSIDFPVEDAKEFPSLTTGSKSNSIEIDSSLLGYWIQRGAPFTVDDEFKKAFECLNIIVKDKKIDVFCFNDNRMYHDSAETECADDFTISINRKSLQGLSLALGDDKKVTLINGEKNITIIGSNTMLLIRKDEMMLPNCMMLLNMPQLFQIRVDKARLLSILSRAQLILDSTYNVTVKFRYLANSIEISAENFEGNKKMSEVIESESVNDYGEFIQSYGASSMKLVVNSINAESVVIVPSGEFSLCRVNNPEYESENAMIMPYAIM